MQSYFEPDPIALQKAKRTYKIAYWASVPFIIALYLLLCFLLSLNPETHQTLKQHSYIFRCISSAVFPLAATTAAIISRYRGVSLEARFYQKYVVHGVTAVEAGTPAVLQTDVLQTDKSVCTLAIALGFIMGVLGLLSLLAPSTPSTPLDWILTGFLSIGIWSTLLWFRGDWFIASVDNEGVTLRQGTYLLPGTAKRKRLTWQEISEVEIEQNRNTTGSFIGGKVLLHEKHHNIVHKIPLTFSTKESRDQFLNRLPKEADW